MSRIVIAIGILLAGFAQTGETDFIRPAAAQSIPAPVDQSAVWTHAFGLESCRGQTGCLEALMHQSGASSQAIAFAKALNFQGYLSALKPTGMIDIGTVTYPFQVNDNDVPVLLNGNPPYIDVWKEGRRVDLTRNRAYAAIKQANPTASYGDDPPRFVGVQPQQGGLSFIYAFEIKTCHACAVLGTVQVVFPFDNRGIYGGAQVVGDFPSMAQPVVQQVDSQDAMKIIDTTLNSGANFSYYLGSFRVVSSAPTANIHAGILNGTLLSVYETEAKTGLISVQYNNASQTVNVTATPSGYRYLTQCAEHQCVRVPQGYVVTDKIIAISQQHFGADDYLIINWTDTFTYSNEFIAYRQAAGLTYQREQRDEYKMLFKYDPIKNQWNKVVFDWTIVGNNFQSNNVSDAIARISSGQGG